MSRMLRFLCAALLMMAVAAALCCALAEPARVHTPGGKLKMRREAGSKGRLVCEIPNRTIVEADEVGDEWCHVVWKNHSGYVMTEYLFLASRSDSPLHLSISAETCAPGEAVRIDASLDEEATYSYVMLGGKSDTVKHPVPYTSVWYRPRKAGVYDLQVTAHTAQGDVKNEIFLRVEEGKASGAAPETGRTEDGLILYSQRDGWWLDKKYGSSNLSASGCAIFTLSHALQALGYTGDAILPENLARKYGFCLVNGGTLNETLIGRTARDFRYDTQPELMRDALAVAESFRQGAVFTFSIVRGHIALAAGLSEDGTMVRIIDSAPSVTMERMEEEKLYIRDASGAFRPVGSLTEIPGASYYFETNSFGGLEYWLKLDYVLTRGVRLIRPRR